MGVIIKLGLVVALVYFLRDNTVLIVGGVIAGIAYMLYSSGSGGGKGGGGYRRKKYRSGNRGRSYRRRR